MKIKHLGEPVPERAPAPITVPVGEPLSVEEEAVVQGAAVSALAGSDGKVGLDDPPADATGGALSPDGGVAVETAEDAEG